MTQKEVRRKFWEQHPEFKNEYRTRKKQNDYNATIRTHFCMWLDQQRRDNIISEHLATTCTLGRY